MHLMFVPDGQGGRIYTLKKVLNGQVTKSAHPARFSPDDKWSRHRLMMHKRYAPLFALHYAQENEKARAAVAKAQAAAEAAAKTAIEMELATQKELAEQTSGKNKALTNSSA
ncbi:uncharacterized protein CTHT_0027550 [Thermochaetoides thermophila DSM 1495]|jgi:Predicted Zn-ribbon RNA-binding protein|uniref:H/ACA ribonucleoprotein complex subunit NOP10 n=1 Tax=Chaetomium thermophilum (strain DSM 1495 / CBS 144.50 / IMI 039719) TaxID=759272 RepID=G0S761_CHATD|nr:hypothetical protein CTHT_0027550 [Thermochaetoides thermophila DSM 1495]EGS20916.1 hypothetical protein CTHT_0027550 [Thermochaetoides thermophila DSM 1495]